MPMRILIIVLLFVLAGLRVPFAFAANTYYVAADKNWDGSPVADPGSNSNDGLSASTAWKDIGRAWGGSAFGRPKDIISPGDTLILLNGIHYDSIAPAIDGTATDRITVKAETDGQAIIDGEFQRIPVALNKWAGADYYTIEGIIGMNGSSQVFQIDGGKENILRRVSAYNANPDRNFMAISIVEGATNNLVEDCIASGSTRYTIMTRHATGTTIRRCFGHWMRWDGREQSTTGWPWDVTFTIYNANQATYENVVAYGAEVTVLSNQVNDPSNDPHIFGSIFLNASLYHDGSKRYFGSIRPLPYLSAGGYTINQPDVWCGGKAGFNPYIVGPMPNAIFRDIFISHSGGPGFAICGPLGTTDNHPQNMIVDHMTVRNTGKYTNSGDGGPGKQLNNKALVEIAAGNIIVTNSFIEGTTYQGAGADITHKYINGVKTPDLLFVPHWPMEDRIRSEMGISVTNLVHKYIPEQVPAMPDTDSPYIGPYLEMIPRELPFDGVDMGTSKTRTAQLLNVGTAPITNARVKFKYYNDVVVPQFTLDTNSCSPADPFGTFSIPVGQSCAISFTFIPPHTSIPVTADIVIESPDLPRFPGAFPATAVYLSGEEKSPITNAKLGTNGTSFKRMLKTSATAPEGSIQYLSDPSSFRFASVPSYLNGEYYLMTRITDNVSATDPLVTFTLTQPATVYIARDAQLDNVQWFSGTGFTSTGETITSASTVGTPVTATFDLYQKSYPAGPVSIKRNEGTSTSNMYTVIVVPERASLNSCLGDITQDRSRDLTDVIRCIRHLVGLETLTGNELAAADANQDGAVDLSDVIRLIRDLLGLEPLPVCQ